MDQVEEVKKRTNIEEVVGGYTQLKQAGRNMKGLCPFHQEKTPSFMVNPELQIYKCFGCGKGGDVINFIEEIEGVDFREALSTLAERAGVELKFNQEDKGVRSEREQMFELLEWAAKYYEYLLREHKSGEEARKYLSERGLKEKVLKHYRVGYVPNQWTGLTEYLVGKKKYSEALLVKSGMAIKSDKGRVYDRFRGRVMFPFVDARGRVVGFSGRILPQHDDGKTGKYINTSESLVFKKSEIVYGFYQAKKAIREADRVVMVEGQLDAISSYQAGIKEVVGVGGTALTENQIRLVGRLTKNVVLALDADSAGEAATVRGIELCEQAGMTLKVVRLKGGKDPDEIARESASGWAKMVDGAVEVYEFLLEAAVERFGVETGEGKRKVSQMVVPALMKINNQVLLGHYVKRLAGLLSVDERDVIAEIDKARKGQDLGKEVVEKIEPVMNKSIEVEILSLVMALGDEVDDSVRMMAKDKGILGKVLTNWLDRGKKKVAEWVRSLPEEVRGVAEEAYLLEVEVEDAVKDLEMVIREWNKRRAKSRLSELRAELFEAESGGTERSITEIEKDIFEVTKRLGMV